MGAEALFDVFGNPCLAPSGGCPEELQGATYTLQCSDGATVEVEAEAATMCGWIKNNAASSPIEVPLTKATVSKLAEYFKFHKDTPPGEIPTPLASDNLVACGAHKWDASFINVDKDLLFELLVAATALEIPSLEMLASAKATLLVKGKSGDKLRKEFNIKNDLPEDEEDLLYDAYAEAKTKAQKVPDEEGLAGVAAILCGVSSAAVKNGIYYGGFQELAPSSANITSWRSLCWRAAVGQDWKLLDKAPPVVCGDRDLMYTAVLSSRGLALQYASSELRGDRQLVLEAAKLNGASLKEASASLREDRAFVLEAVAADGAALAHASDKLRRDRSLVLEAAKGGSGSAMKGASRELASDRDFVLQCAELDAEAFQYAAAELRDDKDMALSVVRLNGAALQFMPPKFKADPDVVAAAVSKDRSALLYAHTSRRADMGASLDWDQKAHLAWLKPGDADEAAFVSPGAMLIGVPQGQDSYMVVKAQKSIQFSALSSLMANMGQSNYISANMVLDKFPCYQRPVIDATTVMWGAVGSIGMRLKAFASADFLNATPEILMSIDDAAKVLHMTTTRMDCPEWYTAAFNVDPSWVGTGGGWKPSEDVAPPRDFKQLETAKDAVQEPQEPEAPHESKDDTSPLQGWPGLAAAPAGAELVLAEGARVELKNLKSKNGTTGTVLKCFPDKRGDKWKVRLDEDKGFACLKASYYQVIAPPAAGA